MNSTIGHGATVSIYLPREASPTTTNNIQERPPIYKSKGETILLVEDEKSLMLLCQSILNNLGYHVKAANSTDEAQLIFKDDPQSIQLLLTDIVMPNMSGLDLANQIQEINPDVKHLFMSGYPQTIPDTKNNSNERTNFIRKPFRASELAAKIREVLDGNVD